MPSYAQVVKKAMHNAQLVARGYSQEELQRRIDAITRELLGPMSNLERVMLCADREAYRKALSAARAI